MFTELEQKRVEKAVGNYVETKRPPVAIRAEVDICFRILDQSVEIYETRPHWRDATQTLESPVMKATFEQERRVWQLFWRRADGKWHRYEPHPDCNQLDEVLRVVDEDAHHCFWG